MVGISARRERRRAGSKRGVRTFVRHPRGGGGFLGGCWNVVKMYMCGGDLVWGDRGQEVMRVLEGQPGVECQNQSVLKLSMLGHKIRGNRVFTWRGGLERGIGAQQDMEGIPAGASLALGARSQAK